MVVYSLKQKKETDELHLFEATPTIDNRCTPEHNSICKEMVLKDTETTVYSCKSEEEMRVLCAKLGRKVCGTCVSSLYATFD